MEAIVNLASTTGNYSRLFLSKRPRRAPLGNEDHRGESTAIGGGELLDKLLRYSGYAEEDTTSIMLKSATQAKKNGLWEEAIDLFMASQHYQQAVVTLTEQLEQNYRGWQKGPRNQTLIERAKRVLKDEGLCQGPTDAHNRDSNPREMQEAVAHLRKLEIVASFFDAYENGDNACQEFNRLWEAQKTQRRPEEMCRPGTPIHQKREQVRHFFNFALSLVADSTGQSGWHERSWLLPVFMPTMYKEQGNLRSEQQLAKMCIDEYKMNPGIQAAVREMLHPICTMQQWLYKDEEAFGHAVTKEQNKQILQMTNRALAIFAASIQLPPNISHEITQLANE